MRHRRAGRQLGRNSSHRRSLFRNLVTSFFEQERIETTEAKAKEIMPMIERMITLGKKGELHGRRIALSYIYVPRIVSHLFSNIAPRFSEIQGGYVRMTKTRIRQGDGAQMVLIELTKTENIEAEKDVQKSS